MSEEKYVSIDTLKKGSIKREKLTSFAEKWMRNIHHSLGDELVGPIEQFEFNFCYDQNELRELFVWNTIASSLEAWEHDHSFCNRKEIFGQLLAFTVGGEVENSLSPITVSELKSLMEKVRQSIKKQILEKN